MMLLGACNSQVLYRILWAKYMVLYCTWYSTVSSKVLQASVILHAQAYEVAREPSRSLGQLLYDVTIVALHIPAVDPQAGRESYCGQYCSVRSTPGQPHPPLELALALEGAWIVCSL